MSAIEEVVKNYKKIRMAGLTINRYNPNLIQTHFNIIEVCPNNCDGENCKCNCKHCDDSCCDMSEFLHERLNQIDIDILLNDQ